MLTPCFGAKWLNSRIALLAISRRVLFLVADFATLGSKPCGMGGGGGRALSRSPPPCGVGAWFWRAPPPLMRAAVAAIGCPGSDVKGLRLFRGGAPRLRLRRFKGAALAAAPAAAPAPPHRTGPDRAPQPPVPGPVYGPRHRATCTPTGTGTNRVFPGGSDPVRRFRGLIRRESAPGRPVPGGTDPVRRIRGPVYRLSVPGDADPLRLAAGTGRCPVGGGLP